MSLPLSRDNCYLHVVVPQMWDFGTGTILHTHFDLDHISYSASLQMSSSCDLVLWCHDDIFQICNIWKGQLKLHRRREPLRELYPAIFSPDSTLIIAGNGRDIEIWDVESDALLRQLKAHSGNIQKIAFAQDGKCFVSSSLDGVIKWWCLGRCYNSKPTLIIS
jgi:WD40 repeat protein